MTAKILLNQTKLIYCAGSSDKLYVVHIVKTPLEYLVECYYGRNGAALTVSVKYRGASMTSAHAAADKVLKEKRGKGYEDYRGSIPGMPASAASASGSTATTSAPTRESRPSRTTLGSYLHPMLSSALTEEDVFTSMLLDKTCAFQRKYDGVRCIIEAILDVEGAFSLVGYNRKGEVMHLPEKVDNFFKLFVYPLKRTCEKGKEGPMFRSEQSYFFDGELMGDTYRIFDLMVLDGIGKFSDSFLSRYSDLEEIFVPRIGNDAHLLLAPTAFTQKHKEKMLKEAREESWEGIIVRKIDGTYEAGIRSKDVLKFKFWDSATCRVLGINDKRSIQLGMLQHGTLVNVGNCTVPINQIIPAVDSLVEVRYLYAHESGSLFQPTLLCVRADKDLPDDRTTLRTTPPEKRGVAFA